MTEPTKDEAPGRRRSLQRAIEDPVGDADGVPAVASGSFQRSTRVVRLAEGDVELSRFTRHCGYSQCDRELPYDGTGRPPEYCKDPRWPGGKTCKQMAQAERDAVRAAGLDVQLREFEATAEGVAQVVAPLREQLSGLLSALSRISDGALNQVGEARREMADALARAEQAERAAEQAHHRQSAAEGKAASVMHRAQEARERADAVRVEAEHRVAAALDRLSIVEREHGQAVARAAAAESARQHDQARRQSAEDEAAAHAAQLEHERAVAAAAHERHEQTRVALEKALQQVEDLQQRVTDEQARALEAITPLQRQVDVLTLERDSAFSLAKAAEKARQETQRAHDALALELAEARAATQAATERAERAETRHDQLVATLSTLAHRGATSER